LHISFRCKGKVGAKSPLCQSDLQRSSGSRGKSSTFQQRDDILKHVLITLGENAYSGWWVARDAGLESVWWGERRRQHGAMRAGVDAKAANAWDAEYAAGRYDDEPPVAFVNDIIMAAKRIGVDHGVYIGCGNGRSYVPLTAAGWT
jgi:hypothetical protein